MTGSCRRAGLDPFLYLRQALARLPTLGAEELDEWLPDRWAARPVQPAGADRRAG